jgi:hypothetical protein
MVRQFFGRIEPGIDQGDLASTGCQIGPGSDSSIFTIVQREYSLVGSILYQPQRAASQA